MDDANADALESRPPTVQDLVKLCRKLNEGGAHYIVIGGMAIAQQGFIRATMGIDLLVEDSDDNLDCIREALLVFPDQVAREVSNADFHSYKVVRVADEVVVDVMLSAGEFDYRNCKDGIEYFDIDGVRIPFAGAELLYRMKMTLREKDYRDLFFLSRKLSK